jgi:putative Mg2+ transporter-C (MgtC) family protein
MPETEDIFHIVVAVILGGLIGLERELRDKPAGFRTIVLICVGACVFTIVSRIAGGPDHETTRIAAQIVTGIGFLGAGAILRDRASIVGLTTAATIWAVAAIGMAVGFGHLGLAAVGTIAILIALLLFDLVERRIGDLRDIQDYHIVAQNTDDTLDRIGSLFEEARLRIRKRVYYEEDASLVVHIIAMGAKSKHEWLRLTLVRSSEYTIRQG